MPYANNHGVQIHFEVEGQGQPLVLGHGLTMTSEDWREYGYVAALREHYSVINIDSRGYGASDKPHDTDSYVWERKAGDVIAVLDALGVSRAHYWGWSFAGDVGFELAQTAPDRWQTMILGGTSSPGGAPSDPAEPNEFADEMAQGGGPWIVQMWKQHLPISAAQEARLMQLDVDALQAEMRAPYMSLKHVPPTMTMPCLMYIGTAEGDHDNARQDSEQMAKGKFVSLPDYNHFQSWAHSEIVLPIALQFLRESS